jgi:hypothetical protein
VRLRPNHAAYRIAFGDAFRAAGESWFAAECYKDALAIEPGNRTARARLAALSSRPERAPEDRSPATPPAEKKKPRESYGGVLGLSYLLAPLVAIGTVAAAESPAGLVFLLTPPAVHLAYGNTEGAGVALLGMLASTGLGGFIGAGVGFGVVGAATEGSSSRDHYFAPELVGAILGAILGASVGYTAWAIVDSSAFAYRDVPAEQNSRRSEPSVVAGVAPLPGGAAGALAGRF